MKVRGLSLRILLAAGAYWVATSAVTATPIEDACARQAVGIQAELRAASAGEWPEDVVQVIREAARRGCLAAQSLGTDDTTVAVQTTGAVAPIGAAAPSKGSDADFMDDLLWDLTHDTKGKYKRSRQFK